jgi:hypothetical protein
VSQYSALDADHRRFGDSTALPSAYSDLLMIVPNSTEKHANGTHLLSTPWMNRKVCEELLRRPGAPRHAHQDVGRLLLRKGDKVCATENVYDASNRLHLAKGEIARVTRWIKLPEGKYALALQTATSDHPRVDAHSVALAHAITVHKSQSLGVPRILFGFHESCGCALLTLIGSRNGLRHMLMHSTPMVRLSCLGARLHKKGGKCPPLTPAPDVCDT